MALKDCYQCDEQISTDALHCPHCGARTARGNQFRQWMILLAVAVGMFVLYQLTLH